MTTTIGLVGLGRMGANMARRLRRAGIDVVAFNRNVEVARDLARETGLTVATTVEDLVESLAPPRTVWLMLPAGAVSEDHVQLLARRLERGDLLVDGANANYKDSRRRAALLEAHGVDFIDAGVSGGVWGLDNGYCLMLGGTPEAVTRLRPAIEALAPAVDTGWVHCGPAGAGHFAKMVHNGIEYGMMQALAEGFSLMRGRTELNLDVAAIARAWQHGSVVRSWLLDLTAEVLDADPILADVAPVVADSGEGRWTAQEAIEQGVPAPVITMALHSRFASQGRAAYADKLLAKMRQAFGGHALAGTRDARS